MIVVRTFGSVRKKMVEEGFIYGASTEKVKSRFRNLKLNGILME